MAQKETTTSTEETKPPSSFKIGFVDVNGCEVQSSDLGVTTDADPLKCEQEPGPIKKEPTSVEEETIESGSNSSKEEVQSDVGQTGQDCDSECPRTGPEGEESSLLPTQAEEDPAPSGTGPSVTSGGAAGGRSHAAGENVPRTAGGTIDDGGENGGEASSGRKRPSSTSVDAERLSAGPGDSFTGVPGRDGDQCAGGSSRRVPGSREESRRGTDAPGPNRTSSLVRDLIEIFREQHAMQMKLIREDIRREEELEAMNRHLDRLYTADMRARAIMHRKEMAVLRARYARQHAALMEEQRLYNARPSQPRSGTDGPSSEESDRTETVTQHVEREM